LSLVTRHSSRPLDRTLFIINPTSARGTTLRAWAAARPAIVSLGHRIEEHFTSRAGEAREVTRLAISQGRTRIVAVGGDGTLGEVLNGYLDQSGKAINPDAAIGLLPSGTGSDFRRSIGIKTIEDSIRALGVSHTKIIDAGRLLSRSEDQTTQSRFFINLASFGLGAEAVAHVNGWRGRLPGWIGGRARFIAAAVLALARYRNVSVKVLLDGQSEIEIESNLLVVANGRFAGGGMMLAPNAQIDDGLFDVILTDRATRLTIVGELPRIERGHHLKNPKVHEHRAREVSISSAEPLAVEIDGELAGQTPAQLSILASAVRFIA
jgi:YegS/Rv2252/BmrU family lipid kinase